MEYIVGRGNIEDFMIVSSLDGSHWASNGDFMVRLYLRDYPTCVLILLWAK